MEKTSSTYKELFFTYSKSVSESKKGTIVLLDGIPSKIYNKEELIKDFCIHGFDVFFPRYEGTWESAGEFLKGPPSKAISEFIKTLKEGLTVDKKIYKAEEIFILASSFGAGVALDIPDKNLIDKMCLLSPVTSFKKVVGIQTLEAYLRDVHTNDYRFKTGNWQKLLNDELWNLDDKSITQSSDALIIIGKEDPQIIEADVAEFAKKHHIKTSSYDVGHITFSKITEPMMNEILSFFEKD